MKKSLLFFVSLLLLALVTACSSNNSVNISNAGKNLNDTEQANHDIQDDNNEAQGATQDTSDQPETKLFVDALGREVEIPTNPKSIVALWSVGEMLALDEKPIGSTANLLRFYPEEDVEGIEIVGDNGTGNFEMVLSMNPDLIIVYARATEEEIAQYSKIAPTVATPFYGDPFETFHMVAEILNKQDEAEQWLAEYQERVEEKRELVKDMNLSEQSALVIQFALKNVYTYRSSTFPVIFDDYQFQLTEKQAQLEEDPNFGSHQLSEEVLPEFDADHIFVIINDDESRQVYEEMIEGPIWKSLKAVQNDHVYLINNRISINNVKTMDWAIDEVYRLLTED